MILKDADFEKRKEKAALIYKWWIVNSSLRSVLPVSDSYIATDLMFQIFFSNKPKVKDIFLMIPSSYTGIRTHYFRLLRHSWIELVASDSDKRIKYVVPSEKLILAFVDLERKMRELQDGEKS